MPTTLDLCRDAMIEINALAPHEDFQPRDAELCRRALNRMLDTWRTQELLCYQEEIVDFPLVVGQPSYQVGPTGQVVRARPSMIDRMGVVQDRGGPNELELPLEVIRTAQRWQAVHNKTLTSTWPTHVYVEWTFPNVTLTPWPILQSGTLHGRLYVLVSIEGFEDLTTNHTFPPGYAEALHYSLAVRFSSLFGVPLPAELAQLAASRVADVKRTNIIPDELILDPALPGMRRRYDIYTDGFLHRGH